MKKKNVALLAICVMFLLVYTLDILLMVDNTIQWDEGKLFFVGLTNFMVVVYIILMYGAYKSHQEGGDIKHS